MNVAFAVTDLAHTRAGGISRVATELGKHLVALGHRVVVYVLDRGPETLAHAFGMELRLIPAFPTINHDYPVAGFSRRAFARLLEDTRRDRFDVVHTFNLNALALPRFSRFLRDGHVASTVSSFETVLMDVRAKWTEFCDRPSVATLAQIGVESYFAARYERDYLRNADRLVTEDHNTRSALEALGVESERISVIPSGVDVDAAQSAVAPVLDALPGVHPLIGYVGRVDPRKGVQYLISAMRGVRSKFPHARLVLVGGSRYGYDKVIDAQVEREGLVGCVKSIGRVPGDILPYYKLFDLLVIPSLSEGIPLTLGEAMASGRPVVITRLPGVVPFVQPPDLVHWAEIADVPSLERAIVAALSDSAADDRARRALAFIREHSWRAVAQRHVAAYQMAVAEMRARASA